MNDEADPVITVQPAGSLTSSQNTDRIRTLAYSASDQGGGVYRQRLIVDGVAQPATIVNDNGGKCGTPFRDPVPCRTAPASASIDLDTDPLADGSHTLRLEVRDATDINKVQTAPWSIVVDNDPPVVGGVQVSGTAREGDSLTCDATATGQSVTVNYAWVRANADGSGGAAIPAAAGKTYVQVAADVGKKILCRASAQDNGGTTVRDSSVTSGPFADGATVASYCSGRPTGKQDECGDADGDGTLNYLDSDDDGDGVPDTTDIAPFDPAIPSTSAGTPGTPGAPGGAGGSGGQGPGGPSGGSGSSGSNGVSNSSATTTLVATDLNTIPMLRNPVSEAVGNGTPASGDALLAVRFAIGRGATLRTSTRVVAAYSQALRVRGTLQTPGNRPIVGASVYLVQKPLGTPDTSFRLDKTARTAADGSFTLPVSKSGRSRDIRVVYFPLGGSNANRGSNPLTLQVRQDATFQVSKRSLRNGSRLAFTGRVLGSIPSSGVDVRVQVRLNRSWFTFTKLTTSRAKGGRFRASHRFTKTTRPTTYRFRILVLPRNRRAYSTGFSRQLDVRVRP